MQLEEQHPISVQRLFMQHVERTGALFSSNEVLLANEDFAPRRGKRVRAGKQQLQIFQDFRLKNGSWQGQNLALTAALWSKSPGSG